MKNKRFLNEANEKFAFKWQRMHYPSMDVSVDVDFFYQLYCELHRLVKEDVGCIDESAIRSLLLYVENTIAIGFDGVYEYRYRSLGNVVNRYSGQLKMSIGAINKLHRLISNSVGKTTCSSLRRWIIDSVLLHDFRHLSGMLTYFVRMDVCLRQIYPDLHFRKAMFRKLISDKLAARRMCFSDFAFNWQDKHGFSLAAIIAVQCRSLAVCSLTDKAEQPLLIKVADTLETIRSERLDTYKVLGKSDDCTLTLQHRDGRVFKNVTFYTSIPDTDRHYLAAQLVTYLGKNYVSGPAVWLDSKDIKNWNGEYIWTDIINKEQEAARQRCFTTPFGRRIILYDDLYTISEDSDKACDVDWGIYWDEPNVFDFLELFGQLK